MKWYFNFACYSYFESTTLSPTLLLGQEEISNTFTLFEAWFHVAQADFKLELSEETCATVPDLLGAGDGTQAFTHARQALHTLTPARISVLSFKESCASEDLQES